jgi:hypothetical protein
VLTWGVRFLVLVLTTKDNPEVNIAASTRNWAWSTSKTDVVLMWGVRPILFLTTKDNPEVNIVAGTRNRE